MGFSQSVTAGKDRGDRSDWMMTPQQRALAIEGGPSAGPALLVAALGEAGGKAAHAAQTVDSYNAALRGKSLMEQHAERQAAAEKLQKKAKRQKTAAAGAGAGAGGRPAAGPLVKPSDDWDATKHPWRPFDREKDLLPPSQGKATAADLMKNSGNLKARFSGNNTQRTFL